MNSAVVNNVRLGIVCPMANEETSATAFIEDALTQVQAQAFKSVTFFVVLDLVSKDQTRALLEAHAQRQPLLQVIWAPENTCIVDAYVRGYRAAIDAGCDWIFEIDAGYSHQPADMPRFFDMMAKGYDCVFGSRFCPGGSMTESPLKRRMISRGGTMLTNTLLRTRLSDMTSGMELFSRAALEHVLARGLMSRGPFFQTEIKTYCHRFRIAEVPIAYRAPSHHIRRAALVDSFKTLSQLVRLRRQGQL
jgi:dolichol-phosphate mannosyltransferase